jgi:hypothetical protein
VLGYGISLSFLVVQFRLHLIAVEVTAVSVEDITLFLSSLTLSLCISGGRLLRLPERMAAISAESGSQVPVIPKRPGVWAGKMTSSPRPYEKTSPPSAATENIFDSYFRHTH